MLSRFRKEVTSIYDEPIKKVLVEMEQQPVESEEYAACVRHLETLHKLKADEKPKRVSADTMWNVAGSLAGILVIVAYEQKHVMTTKAIGFIPKLKN